MPGQVSGEVRRLDDRSHVRHGARKVARKVEAPDPDAAAVGPREADEHANRRGLAGAVGPQEPEHFAGIELDGHVRHRLALAEALRQVLGGENDFG